jgi:hypothetical protein
MRFGRAVTSPAGQRAADVALRLPGAQGSMSTK